MEKKKKKKKKSWKYILPFYIKFGFPCGKTLQNQNRCILMGKQRAPIVYV